MQCMRAFGPMVDLLDPVNRGGSDYRGDIYNRAAVEEACLRNKYRRALAVGDRRISRPAAKPSPFSRVCFSRSDDARIDIVSASADSAMMGSSWSPFRRLVSHRSMKSFSTAWLL